MTETRYVKADIDELHEQFDQGDCRWWVNDSGDVSLEGTVTYKGSSELNAKVEGYVGLVDEHEGGMIAYGTPEMMDRMADLLNRLDAIERIARPIKP
jgi:hypothetical protein